MKISKIQLTKKHTVNVVYENENGDNVSVTGANLAHRDLIDAMRAFVPHLAFLTEQRESVGMTLADFTADELGESNVNLHHWLFADTIVIGDADTTCAIGGTRLLQTGDIIKVEAPSIEIADEAKYQYVNDLALAMDALKYEAEQYLTEQKWGVKEATIDFGEDDPFNAENLTADQVPEANIGDAEPKKKGKGKSKKVA